MPRTIGIGLPLWWRAIRQNTRGKGEVAAVIEAGVRLDRLVAMLSTVAACARPETGARTVTPSSTLRPQACFLLYEMGVGEVRRSPAEACSTRVTPASTFKVAHALAALDSGVLADQNVTFRYDGSPNVPESWKRDHTLATAMRYSVVPYFRWIATMLGPDREREYLARFHYGNENASSGLTTFWLDGSLQISPDEQEKFLVALYEDRLPVTKRATETVREILVQPPGVVVNAQGEHPFDPPWPAGTTVSAKTGSAADVTWLVGHVQRQDRAWVFVSCVAGPTERDPLAAMNLAAISLREAQVL
jgi:beta-lactamase class D